MGKYIIIIGIVIVVIGVLVHFYGNIFSWFGNLPGDIKIVKENSRVFIPITSMIIITVILNILIKVIQKF